ncbi:aspartic proteinase 36-like [Lolium rigidum]|uniref:aspartic proteinase 36-like n=1 Tax=Lolium rigidum TaxID=89674 RepID=UPI001F5D3FA1|nr:aspartic proteinase 36-like [Lolium rigidum]
MALAVLLAAATAAAAAAPALLLQRTRPLQGTHLDHMKELVQVDKERLSGNRGAFDFALQGMPGFPKPTFVTIVSKLIICRLYYARVKLGNPPKEYYVQFDTGSDIMWISGNPCTGCPKSSELKFPLELYNPNSSATSSRISCSDHRCIGALKTGYAICNSSHSPRNQCGYSFTYADGGATSGYYVTDTIYLDTILGNEGGVNSSATVLFGCSNSRTGIADGVIGFGKGAISVISQLSAQRLSGKVFSHCLKRSEYGGGILILGEVVKPGFVSTPLVTTQPRYNVNMKSITVNGKLLQINSSLFATSTAKGTVLDSGTTLTYLADGLYEPVISAIHAAVSPSVRSFVHIGIRYFVTRALSLFPTVTLYFEDGAAMKVGPESYLVRQGYYDNDDILCVGFQRSMEIEGYEQTTILGDLVLRDKIVVYNLDKMRVGWVDYDCSLLNTTTPFVASGSMGYHAPTYYISLIVAGVAVIMIAASQLFIYSTVSKQNGVIPSAFCKAKKH